MVLFLLFSLFFYHDICGSFPSSPFKQIKERTEDYQAALSYVGLQEKSLYVYESKDVSIQCMNKESKINKNLEAFRKKQNRVKTACLGKEFEENVLLTISSQQKSENVYLNKPESTLASITFPERSKYKQEDTGVKTLIADSTFFSEDNGIVSFSDLVVANILYYISQEKNVIIPIFGQTAKNVIFNTILPKIIPGVPLLLKSEQENFCPLVFSMADFQVVARLTVANDEIQRFNEFTFRNTLNFFRQNHNEFILQNASNFFYHNISTQNLDQFGNQQEESKEQEKDELGETFIKQVSVLHQKCLIKGLASETIIQKIYSIVAGNFYPNMTMGQSLDELLKKSGQEIELAVDQKKVLKNKMEKPLYQQNESTFSNIAYWIALRSMYMAGYLAFASFVYKGGLFLRNFVKR